MFRHGMIPAMAAKGSTIADIFRQRCPRCRLGKIFARSVFIGFPKMHQRCPVCQLRFEREPGYFLGAMYISYGLGIGVIAALAMLVWAVLNWPLMKSVVAGIVLFLPLAPVLTWMARVLWIYMDQAIDPDRT